MGQCSARRRFRNRSHPKDPSVRYIRTDVGGAYRWNPENEEWIPILDWVGRENGTWYGVDGVALDPEDTNIVYLCVGDSGRPSDIIKSCDRGETWEELGFCKNFLGNGMNRAFGECIMVDPNNSDIIYVGTRWQGNFRTLDGGKTFVCIDDGLARGRATPICADRKVYGRIYMASGGRGFYYAEPTKE